MTIADTGSLDIIGQFWTFDGLHDATLDDILSTVYLRDNQLRNDGLRVLRCVSFLHVKYLLRIVEI